MSVLPPLSEVETFAELLPIVKNAEAKATPYGFRSVLLKPDPEASQNIFSWLWTYSVQIKSEQEVDIDALAQCMIFLIESNQNFSEKERPLVQKISTHIDRIYDKSHELEFSIWFPITCIFIWVRDLFNTRWSHFGYSDTQWSWGSWVDAYDNEMPGYNHRYLHYTKAQYRKVTGHLPDHSPVRGTSDLWHLKYNEYDFDSISLKDHPEPITIQFPKLDSKSE